MFGCIVASRPINVDFQKLSDTQGAFNIPSQPSFNHIVVFLLPGQTLPDTHAAGVYIQIPPAQDFQLLGAISAQKQSAIFKINAGSSAATATNGAGSGQAGGGDDLMLDEGTLQPPLQTGAAQTSVNIVIGISVEPVANIEQQLMQLRSRQQQPSQTPGSQLVLHRPTEASQTGRVSTKVLAQRIIENAFNFLSSFSEGPNSTVPIKKFQDWWTKFEKRIEMDPSFLEKAANS